jgi:hypothetical protein
MTQGVGIVGRLLVIVAILVCALSTPSLAPATPASTESARSPQSAPLQARGAHVYDALSTATTPLATARITAFRSYDGSRNVSRACTRLSTRFLAAKAGMSWAERSGILRDAARGKGNYGLGSGTSREADALGRDWVGQGHTVANDGKTLVSSDGLRQYRPPSFKPNIGRHQANFERRFEGQRSRGWQGNGHLNITDLR